MMWLSVAAVFGGLFWLIRMALPGRRVSKSRLGIERKPADVGRSVGGMLGAERQRRLAQALNLADISIESGQFALRVFIVSLLLGILGLLLGPIWALLGLGMPYLCTRSWIGHKGRKRQAKFTEQLPDFLQALTMSLRAGFGLGQSLDTVIAEAENPIKIEFERALAEVRMGRDLSEAMRSLAKRMDSTDLEWVVGAVDINRETGGNLSEILLQVNGTIRERARIGRKVRTFTAEGRLSAQILTALPFVLGVWQWMVHPDEFSVLFSGTGLVVLIACGVLMVIGWFWIRRIVTIKF